MTKENDMSQDELDGRDALLMGADRQDDDAEDTGDTADQSGTSSDEGLDEDQGGLPPLEDPVGPGGPPST